MPSSTDENQTGTSVAGKYLTFKLVGEEYGLSLLKVREIIAMMDITPVPLSPPHLKGVMNLRGQVIPVIDLKSKFNLDDGFEFFDRKCIIVVDVARGGTSTQMSMLVDSVCEVLQVSADDVEEPPAFGNEGPNAYVLGLAKSTAGVKILLNIDNVLWSSDVVNLDSIKTSSIATTV